jgi:uncharacterized protein with von Willebrand factor type A (vWA) domain
MREGSDNLAAKIVEFCERLRTVHGFNIGPREAIEAVQVIEIVGVSERRRVAAALRAVCCSKPEEIELFNRAFDAFFASAAPGSAHPTPRQRRTRPVRDDTLERADSVEIKRQPESESAAQAWQALLARYSPNASASSPPEIPIAGLDAALREVDRLMARLRLGRSLRWKPRPRGERFDLRRTLRAGLRTGGDLLEPHTLGHPLRNPRFVILLDGSRSMTEHAPRMLQFAYAFCKRSRRTNVFFFSTRLQEVTRSLRDADRNRSYRLGDLGDAWGGGTRIGASLNEFVRKYGARLSTQTFVIVVSDGLDAGEIPRLQHAMHEIARRCAGIGWLNPDAARPGYAPSARGMAAALPYVSTFTSFDRIDALTNLGRKSRVAACA